MSKYENLRTPGMETNDLFRARFEKALDEAWNYYRENGMNVDRFEDDFPMYAFAKGFLAGCIYAEDSSMIVDEEEEEREPMSFDVIQSIIGVDVPDEVYEDKE